MPLSEAEKQAIREEEYFRAEVRKEIAGAKGPPSVFQKISDFLETKSGFWLLTTVLAGVVATGFTTLQHLVNREEIARQAAAERARRDADMLLKLGPMLTSEKRSQIDVAMVLLDGLASDKAVESRIANQVRALFQNTVTAGAQPNATAEERTQAAAIVAYADRAPAAPASAGTGTGTANAPASAAGYAGTLTSAALVDVVLPARVYIQIGSETDRPAAMKTADAFRKAGIIAPGIELVPAKNSPPQPEIRYCEGKVAADAPERLRTIAATELPSPPRLLILNPTLCSKVRSNHFELWLARKTA